jgi:hypothetical protein
MNRKDTTRIAIQERQRLFREGLELVLDGEPDLSVVSTAPTAVVVYLDEHRSVRPVREAKVMEMFGAQVIGIHLEPNPRGFTPSAA